jgi:hypothetical protein
MAELYDVKHDPEERTNLIADVARAPLVRQLQAELAKLMEETGISPGQDQMPLDKGIGVELPDQKIR